MKQTTPDSKRTGSSVDRRKGKLKVSTKFQIGLLGTVWSLVGTGLVLAAILHLVLLPEPNKWLWTAIAAIGGLIKGRYVIAKSAHRLVTRIKDRGDGQYPWDFIPPKMWLLIALMMFMGFMLRHSSMMPLAIWSIYTAIGIALLTGSILVWKNFWQGDDQE